MFQTLKVICRRGNFVNYHWECTSIYRPLSCPFRYLFFFIKCIFCVINLASPFGLRSMYVHPLISMYVRKPTDFIVIVFILHGSAISRLQYIHPKLFLQSSKKLILKIFQNNSKIRKKANFYVLQNNYKISIL